MDAPMPLSMAAAGTPLRIVSIDAGRDLARRLADLGLTPGVAIRRVEASVPVGPIRQLGQGRLGFLRRVHGGQPDEPRPHGGLGRGFGFGGRWHGKWFGGHADRHRPGRGPGHGRRPREVGGNALVVEFAGTKIALGYGVGQRIRVVEEPKETGPRLER